MSSCSCSSRGLQPRSCHPASTTWFCRPLRGRCAVAGVVFWRVTPRRGLIRARSGACRWSVTTCTSSAWWGCSRSRPGCPKRTGTSRCRRHSSAACQLQSNDAPTRRTCFHMLKINYRQDPPFWSLLETDVSACVRAGFGPRYCLHPALNFHALLFLFQFFQVSLVFYSFWSNLTSSWRMTDSLNYKLLSQTIIAPCTLYLYCIHLGLGHLLPCSRICLSYPWFPYYFSRCL